MGKKINFFLILIGAVAIGSGFTDFITEDMKMYVIGGGGILILLVLVFWWLGRRKRKMAYAPGRMWKPGLGDAREMPALTPKKIKAIDERREGERKRLRNAEVMEMRAVDPKKLRTGTA